MNDRSHLSIGEVLALLQDEYPDVTISKIRFLESQGLLDPERTPSGYRKFYEGDIERLRWILRQQKDNFLPLKVIKDRLASGQLDDAGGGDAPARGHARAGRRRARPSPRRAAPGRPSRGPRRTPSPSPSSGHPRPAAWRTTSGTRSSRAAAVAAATAADPRQVRCSTGDRPASASPRTRSCRRRAAPPRSSADLERFGPRHRSGALGNTVYYGGDALIVAQLASGFMAHGVEARHLRMYKVAAEREAGVFEQLVMPLLKQRNPGARQQATERLDELAGLGSRLRDALLREALQDHLGGRPEERLRPVQPSTGVSC